MLESVKKHLQLTEDSECRFCNKIRKCIVLSPYYIVRQICKECAEEIVKLFDESIK